MATRRYFPGRVNTKGLRHVATFFGCCLFFVCVVLPIHGVTVELGLTGGGGLAFAYGSFLDSKTAALAELGAASFTTVGSSQAHLFPGWTAGVYGQIDLLSWLALRLEVVFESAGAERLALTSGGAPFDHYGLSFASVHIPVHALARTAIGPGQLYALLGPFLGIVAGSITVVDRYATATTTAVITPDISQVFFFGLSGGIGYAIGLGPGRAGIELRSDWSILPVSAGSGQSGGNMNPISLNLVVSYGFQLGKPVQ